MIAQQWVPNAALRCRDCLGDTGDIACLDLQPTGLRAIEQSPPGVETSVLGIADVGQRVILFQIIMEPLAAMATPKPVANQSSSYRCITIWLRARADEVIEQVRPDPAIGCH